MILKDCPFCKKPIPRSITVCPYCHRNEQGQSIKKEDAVDPKYFENDLKELGSEDAFTREQAVVRMAQKGFGVVQALIGILADHGKPGLAGIAKVLGRVRDRRAIEVLKNAAKAGDEELRAASIWALAQFQEPEILPSLLAEAQRPPTTIQGYLAFVLGGYQDASVVPVLTRLLKHTSREVAFQAAYALGETRDPQAISALRKAMRRRDPLIQAAAGASLRRMGASVRTPVNTLLAIGGLLLLAAGLAFFFWNTHK